jgi:hypothetical protein
VLHKRVQLRLLPSVLGDSLPERLRSTLIAMLGITAAVGLGLVAVALQQGFPLVASGPIPEPPVKREAARHRAVPQERPAAVRRDATPVPAADDIVAAATEGPGGIAPAESPPSEAAPVLVTDAPSAGDGGEDRKRPSGRAPASPRPAAQAPPAAPEEEPTATPSSEAPEPAPEPEPGPAPPSHPGNGYAYGKGHGSSGSPPGQESKGSSGSPPGQESKGSSGSPPGHE